MDDDKVRIIFRGFLNEAISYNTMVFRQNSDNGRALLKKIKELEEKVLSSSDDSLKPTVKELTRLLRYQVEMEAAYLYTTGFANGISLFHYLDHSYVDQCFAGNGFENLVD